MMFDDPRISRVATEIKLVIRSTVHHVLGGIELLVELDSRYV